MRIEEFHVDGFGRFHNLPVTALRPGLSIVLGNNEAGKSTLLAFLRSVLFGLPSRKQAEYYPPLSGGRHGGRIVLIDDKAEKVVVERFAGKGSGKFTATLPNGSQIGEEQFRQRLGMVTGDVYEKVFAFGLGELQTFETLQGDNIRDAMYSAEMGTGGQSPAQVVKKLNERCESLFKPGGKNPEMNQILKRLMQRRQKIGEHTADQDEHQRIQKELKQTDQASANIRSELHRCRQRLARLQTLQQSRDDWILLVSYREQLRSLPQIESFPQDGVSRIGTLLGEQRSLRDQLQKSREEQGEAEQELAALQVDETMLSLHSEIGGLERRTDLYEQDRQQLAGAQTEERLAREQLNQSLLDLGEEWNQEKLRSFDLSIPAGEELDAARQECLDLDKRVEQHLPKVEHLDNQLRENQEIEQTERDKLEPLVGPVAKVDVEGICRLRRNQTAYEAARRDLPQVNQECQGNEQRLREALRSIGPDWTEAQLEEFDDSLLARETINNHREKLSHLRSRQTQLSGRLEDAGQSIRDHQAAVERDETLLASLPGDDEDIDETSLHERKNSLRALGLLMTQHAQLISDIAHQDERKQDLEGQLSRLDEDVEEAAKGIPPWLVIGVGLLGPLVLLVLGLGRGEWVIGAVVLVVLIAVAVFLHFVRRTAPAAIQVKRQRRARDRELIAQRIAEVEMGRSESCDEESGLSKRIQQQSESAVVDTPTSGRTSGQGVGNRHVAEQEKLIDRQLMALQQRRPIEQRRDDRQTQLKDANTACADAQRSLEDSERELKEAEACWRGWLSEASLPETLSPEVAVEVLSRLDTARELLKAISDQRHRIDDMQEEIKSYAELLLSVGANCGIENLPQEIPAAVQLLANRLDEQEERQRGIEVTSRSVREAERRTAKSMERLQEAQRLHAAELKCQQSADQEWIELLRSRGLRETLTVQHADQMMQGIERAREQLTHLDKHTATEKSLSQRIDTFVNEVGSVAHQAELDIPRADKVATCIETLVTQLKQAEEGYRRQEQLQETSQKSDDRVKGLQEQIDERQKDIDQLLTASDTKDEESFRQRATDYQKLQSLKNDIRALETRLRQAAGSADALPALERELEQLAPEALQTEQQDLDAAVEDCERKKEEAVRLSENLGLQLQELENSEEISSLRIQQQSDLAEFRNYAREWAILKMATHLIDRAREMYERERRPAVLKQAERYFTRLTHGHYSEILTAEDEPLVVAADGTRKELRHLSRGTAEQLYLSLRFGFVEEYMQRSEPLPLIFDDILVNFDPDRASAAADAVVELSRNQQILFFTCHPTTVRLLSGIDRDAAVFELQDGRLTDGCLPQA